MKIMDTSRDAMEEEEKSDEFLLLEKYCTRRGKRYRSGVPLPFTQGLGPSRHSKGTGFKQSSIESGFSLMNVVGSLADIADSVVPIEEGDLKIEADSSSENQQDLVEKLVVLLKKEGDDINEKIKENKVLQQQLQGALSYSLFERLMAALQGGRPVGSAAPGASSAPSASETRLRKEQIAWVFEVTHRLSAIDQIPKRRALNFGSHFLRQHHSEWVQQHGGWEKVFTVKGACGPNWTSTDLS